MPAGEGPTWRRWNITARKRGGRSVGTCACVKAGAGGRGALPDATIQHHQTPTTELRLAQCFERRTSRILPGPCAAVSRPGLWWSLLRMLSNAERAGVLQGPGLLSKACADEIMCTGLPPGVLLSCFQTARLLDELSHSPGPAAGAPQN